MKIEDIPNHLLGELVVTAQGQGIYLLLDYMKKEVDVKLTRLSTSVPAEEFKLSYQRLQDSKEVMTQLTELFAKIKQQTTN